MKSLTLRQAIKLAYRMYGENLGTFGKHRIDGKFIRGQYFSQGLNKVITAKELIAFHIKQTS